LRLINWNIERRGPLKWQAASIASEIASLDPDLVFLTEAHENSMLGRGGHTLSHPGYNAGRKADSERLVLLWSKSPWEAVPLSERLQENGGAIFGRTVVEDRDVYCLCLCIPWHMSPCIPPDDKVRPWAQHMRFLELLQQAMPKLLEYSPLIIAGDFNQFIPRSRGSKGAGSLLQDTFAGTRILTEGELPPLGLKTIDHVSVCGPITVAKVDTLDRFDTVGRPRSDHFGVMVDFDWS